MRRIMAVVGCGVISLGAPCLAQAQPEAKAHHHTGKKKPGKAAGSAHKAAAHKKTVRKHTSHTGRPHSAAGGAHAAHGTRARGRHTAVQAAPAPRVAAPVALPAPAPQPAPEPDKGISTGLPLPRFAALRADEVNMRTGPGTRYPIEWVYYRRGLPVKITREFDVWRLVEDLNGQKGWIHQATLMGGRTFVIPGQSPSVGEVPPQDDDDSKKERHRLHTEARITGYVKDASSIMGGVVLRDAPREDGAAVAVLRPGVVGVLRECPAGSQWCKVSVKQYAGWLPRNSMWGLLPGEVFPKP